MSMFERASGQGPMYDSATKSFVYVRDAPGNQRADYNWWASLVPAAAVTPAPEVYGFVAETITFVVGISSVWPKAWVRPLPRSRRSGICVSFGEHLCLRP